MPNEWTSQGLLQAAVMQVSSAVVITDADFTNDGPHVVLCNPAFVEMTGNQPEEIVGRNLRVLQGPDTDPEVISRLRECLRDDRYFEGQTVNYRQDGTSYHVVWSISPVRNGSGRVTHYVSVQQDITERLRAEAERDMMAEALRVIAEPIMVTDAEHRILYVNRAFEDLTGYTADVILGKTPRVLFAGTPDEAVVYETVTSALEKHCAVRENITIRTRDGRTLHTVHSVTPSLTGNALSGRNVSSFTDVTDLVHSVDEFAKQANTDALTGLLNRRAGTSVLHSRLEERSSGRALSVAMCDIDHFKSINDTYGHGVGDQVLGKVARELAAQVREADVAIRWGGEEFLLILSGVPLATALQTAERVRAAIERSTHDLIGSVTISIGVAEAATGDDEATLLARADSALYAAKGNGRNRVEAG